LGFKRLELGEEDEAWDSFHEGLKLDQALVPLIKGCAEVLSAEGRSNVASNLLETLRSETLQTSNISRRTGGSSP